MLSKQSSQNLTKIMQDLKQPSNESDKKFIPDLLQEIANEANVSLDDEEPSLNVPPT
jgi:hypothetical protein